MVGNDFLDILNGIGSLDKKPKQFAEFRALQNQAFTASESKLGKFWFGPVNRFVDLIESPTSIPHLGT